MPSFAHEAPLVLFRERPELVARLLRDALGVDLPAFGTASLIEADFSQLLPAEFRADLVIRLDEGGTPAMGLVVEVQRDIDRDKRRSWPLYVAALHARLRCSTCLVVVAATERVAGWARAPITTLQPGSSFTPLVLGPEQIPWITEPEQARQAPELTVLSAIAHGNEPAGLEVALSAVEALRDLDDAHAILYYDLIVGALTDVARRALENEMEVRDYEFRSEFARSHFARGREEGREEGREQVLEAARRALRELVQRRLGDLPGAIAERIAACAELDELMHLIVEIGSAPDRAAVERLLAR